MITLIRKDFMSSKIKLWHLGEVLVIVSLAFILGIVEQKWMMMFSFSLLGLSPIIYFSNLSNYTETDDYKSEIILPIKKSHVVIARYMMYLLIIGLVFCTVIALLWYLGSPYSEFSVIMFGTSAMFIFGGTLLFLIFIWGQDKVKNVLIICLVLTLLFMEVVFQSATKILGVSTFRGVYDQTHVMLTVMVVAFCFYLVSCFISIMIFKRKQF